MSPALSAQRRSPLDESEPPPLDTRSLLTDPLDRFLKDLHDKTAVNRAVLNHLLHQTFPGSDTAAEPESDLILEPDADAATIGPEILSFITGPGSVAGRSSAYANTLGSVLLPDMLIVQTDKPPATAGWLSWLPLSPFADGWGGRRLQDDVTDLALLALFGDPFGADPQGAAGKEALTSDQVSFDSQVLSAFPYVGAPN